MSVTNAQPEDETEGPPAAHQASWLGRALTTSLVSLVVCVGAVLVTPPVRESLGWALPSRPTSDEIQNALEAALDQIYRSFELNDEAAAYDRIAQSVIGDAVRDIYLEVRQSWLDEASGRVLIDRVQVDAVDDLAWQSDGTCRLDATWTVHGSIGHFGHSHQRQNRYRAQVEMVRNADTWKVQSVYISEFEREQ